MIIAEYKKIKDNNKPVLVYRQSTPQEDMEHEAALAKMPQIQPSVEQKMNMLMEYMGLTAKQISPGVFEVKSGE